MCICMYVNMHKFLKLFVSVKNNFNFSQCFIIYIFMNHGWTFEKTIGVNASADSFFFLKISNILENYAYKFVEEIRNDYVIKHTMIWYWRRIYRGEGRFLFLQLR